MTTPVRTTAFHTMPDRPLARRAQWARMRRACAVLGLAILTLTPQHPAHAADAAPGEHFILNLPLGWHEVTRSTPNGGTLVAYAPAGQTEAAWNDMITVESVPAAVGINANGAYARMSGQYEAACAISNAGKLQTGAVNGYAAAFWVVGCGERPGTGRGEVAFVHLIQGDTATYIIERVWQTPVWHQEGPPITADEANAARATLKSFSVCNTGSSTHPCTH